MATADREALAAAVFDGCPNLFLPAIVTPLTPDREIDTASARTLCAAMFRQGAGGLYVCGNTGEGMHLSEEARQSMALVAVQETAKAGGGRVCIIHVGAAQPDEALRLAKHARDIGASAVSSLPPFVTHFSFAYTVEFYT